LICDPPLQSLTASIATGKNLAAAAARRAVSRKVVAAAASSSGKNFPLQLHTAWDCTDVIWLELEMGLSMETSVFAIPF
jgi:hypothetical protein